MRRSGYLSRKLEVAGLADAGAPAWREERAGRALSRKTKKMNMMGEADLIEKRKKRDPRLNVCRKAGDVPGSRGSHQTRIGTGLTFLRVGKYKTLITTREGAFQER